MVQKLAQKMQSKFDKLCGRNLTLELILDPKYKMQFVELTYSELYEVGVASSNINGVGEKLRLIYETCEIYLNL